MRGAPPYQAGLLTLLGSATSPVRDPFQSALADVAGSSLHAFAVAVTGVQAASVPRMADCDPAVAFGFGCDGGLTELVASHDLAFNSNSRILLTSATASSTEQMSHLPEKLCAP